MANSVDNLDDHEEVVNNNTEEDHNDKPSNGAVLMHHENENDHNIIESKFLDDADQEDVTETSDLIHTNV